MELPMLMQSAKFDCTDFSASIVLMIKQSFPAESTLLNVVIAFKELTVQTLLIIMLICRTSATF